MSKPIRSKLPCHCIVGSNGRRYDTKPWYTKYGNSKKEETNNCPDKIDRHKITVIKTDIKSPFGDIIGTLHCKDGGSTYIEINNHINRKWFFNKDVYCNECDCWHFK